MIFIFHSNPNPNSLQLVVQIFRAKSAVSFAQILENLRRHLQEWMDMYTYKL